MGYNIITVNGGHSATSKGASGNGYQEHEVARQIKDKLIKAFQNIGQKTADTTSDAKTANAVLMEQVYKCNAFNDSGLDVSIHLNAGGGTGVEVLYYTEKELASKVSKAIANVLGLRDRGAKERKDLYFLKHTKRPAILIEVCFIDNVVDMTKLMGLMDSVVVSIVKSLTGKETTAKETYKNYTIRSGETLSKIAQRESLMQGKNVTISEIMAINPAIKNKNIIYSGQVIKIPLK